MFLHLFNERFSEKVTIPKNQKSSLSFIFKMILFVVSELLHVTGANQMLANGGKAVVLSKISTVLHFEWNFTWFDNMKYSTWHTNPGGGALPYIAVMGMIGPFWPPIFMIDFSDISSNSSKSATKDPAFLTCQQQLTPFTDISKYFIQIQS